MSESALPPVAAVVETAVYADDLAAAEAFYAGVLGLPMAGPEPGRHVFFRVGDAATRPGPERPTAGPTNRFGGLP